MPHGIGIYGGMAPMRTELSLRNAEMPLAESLGQRLTRPGLIGGLCPVKS